VLSRRREFPEALEHYWKGEVILERLASQDRAPRTWRVQLDYARTRIANILQHEELPEEHLALKEVPLFNGQQKKKRLAARFAQFVGE
jgi:hypothetical protein